MGSSACCGKDDTPSEVKTDIEIEAKQKQIDAEANTDKYKEDIVNQDQETTYDSSSGNSQAGQEECHNRQCVKQHRKYNGKRYHV